MQFNRTSILIFDFFTVDPGPLKWAKCDNWVCVCWRLLVCGICPPESNQFNYLNCICRFRRVAHLSSAGEFCWKVSLLMMSEQRRAKSHLKEKKRNEPKGGVEMSLNHLNENHKETDGRKERGLSRKRKSRYTFVTTHPGIDRIGLTVRAYPRRERQLNQ